MRCPECPPRPLCAKGTIVVEAAPLYQAPSQCLTGKATALCLPAVAYHPSQYLQYVTRPPPVVSLMTMFRGQNGADVYTHQRPNLPYPCDFSHRVCAWKGVPAGVAHAEQGLVRSVMAASGGRKEGCMDGMDYVQQRDRDADDL